MAAWIVAVGLAAIGGLPTDALAERLDRAVKRVGLSAVVPIYSFAVQSAHGWRDEPRTESNFVGAGSGVVAPLGEDLGARLSLGGGWAKSSFVPSNVLASSAHSGSLNLATSVFWRVPQRGELGLGYSAWFGFANAIDYSQGHGIGPFASLFCGDFDFGARASYGHHRSRTNPFGIALDSTSNGLSLLAYTRWYAMDGLSTSLSASYSYAAAKGGDLAMAIDQVRNQGGASASLSWLPPSGHLRYVVLDASFSYERSRIDAPSIFGEEDVRENHFSLGAALRVVWPGVASLKELERHY